MSAEAGSPSGTITVVPDRLYRVGGSLTLDGRLTWAPADARGFQPANTYVVREPGYALIVDPGLASVQSEVVAGLRSLITADITTEVFLTRAQLDSVGNLGAVAAALPGSTMFTGGRSNPFDQFDAVGMLDDGSPADIPVLRGRDPGAPHPAADLEIIDASLRILNTFWLWHPATGTLFTSDSFTHGVVEHADDRPVIDTVGAPDAIAEAVRGHLFATLWWLPYARTEAIVGHLREIFETHDVERIAPARGCILEGRDVVRAHADAVARVLQDADVALQGSPA